MSLSSLNWVMIGFHILNETTITPHIGLRKSFRFLLVFGPIFQLSVRTKASFSNLEKSLAMIEPTVITFLMTQSPFKEKFGKNLL